MSLIENLRVKMVEDVEAGMLVKMAVVKYNLLCVKLLDKESKLTAGSFMGLVTDIADALDDDNKVIILEHAKSVVEQWKEELSAELLRKENSELLDAGIIVSHHIPEKGLFKPIKIGTFIDMEGSLDNIGKMFERFKSYAENERMKDDSSDEVSPSMVAIINAGDELDLCLRGLSSKTDAGKEAVCNCAEKFHTSCDEALKLKRGETEDSTNKAGMDGREFGKRFSLDMCEAKKLAPNTRHMPEIWVGDSVSKSVKQRHPDVDHFSMSMINSLMSDVKEYTKLRKSFYKIKEDLASLINVAPYERYESLLAHESTLKQLVVANTSLMGECLELLGKVKDMRYEAIKEEFRLDVTIDDVRSLFKQLSDEDAPIESYQSLKDQIDSLNAEMFKLNDYYNIDLIAKEVGELDWLYEALELKIEELTKPYTLELKIEEISKPSTSGSETSDDDDKDNTFHQRLDYAMESNAESRYGLLLILGKELRSALACDSIPLDEYISLANEVDVQIYESVKEYFELDDILLEVSSCYRVAFNEGKGLVQFLNTRAYVLDEYNKISNYKGVLDTKLISREIKFLSDLLDLLSLHIDMEESKEASNLEPKSTAKVASEMKDVFIGEEKSLSDLEPGLSFSIDDLDLDAQKEIGDLLKSGEVRFSGSLDLSENEIDSMLVDQGDILVEFDQDVGDFDGDIVTPDSVLTDSENETDLADQATSFPPDTGLKTNSEFYFNDNHFIPMELIEKIGQLDDVKFKKVIDLLELVCGVDDAGDSKESDNSSS